MEINLKNASYGIVARKENSMYGYHGWPSICKDDNGVLYAVCSGYRMGHICPFGKTVMYKSLDEGKTWSVPIIINDSELDDRDAGIIALGDNKLLAAWFSHPAKVYLDNDYNVNYIRWFTPDESIIAFAQLASFRNIPQERSGGGSFVSLSRDGGNIWSEPVRVPVSAPHGPALLSDGSLFYLGKEFNAVYEEDSKISAYTSTDDGMSWEKVSEVECPEGYGLQNFHEPHVMELADGRLLGVIRAQGSPVYHGFSIFTCVSRDRGRSWTIPKCIGISGSPPHLLLHSSGAIICSFGRREVPFGERAVISTDGGDTWEKEYILYPGVNGDLGYPASVELSDGSILTVYYQHYSNDRKTSILYTKWSLDDKKSL